MSEQERESQETPKTEEQETVPRPAETSIHSDLRLWAIRVANDSGEKGKSRAPGALMAIVIGEPDDAMLDFFEERSPDNGILIDPVPNGFQIQVAANGGWILHDPGSYT